MTVPLWLIFVIAAVLTCPLEVPLLVRLTDCYERGFGFCTFVKGKIHQTLTCRRAVSRSCHARGRPTRLICNNV